MVFRSGVSTEEVFLDSDSHAKVEYLSFLPNGLGDRRFEYDGSRVSHTLEANIHSFGLLFYSVLFDQFDDEVTFEIRPPEPDIPDNVWQLIQRCCAEDPKERPTMDQVVQEMESWISSGQFTLSS
ncbi:hypothetical protein JOM56_010949 [Amanita muscaria]